MKLKKLNYKFNKWWFSILGLKVDNKKKFKLFSDIGFYLTIFLFLNIIILSIIINFDFLAPLFEFNLMNIVLWICLFIMFWGVFFYG